jgi:hypothetical protein
MPAPVYSAGTYGNTINAVSTARGATIAAFLDLSTAIQGQVNCEIVTGASAPTAGTAFSAYRAYAAGGSPPITLSSGVSAGATSISVSSATGLHVGQNIALVQVGGSKLGEVVSISAISGTTITISATINAYSTSDAVYLMGQTAVTGVTPSGPTGTWAVNKDYSAPLYLGTGQYIIAANNADSAQAVTVSVTTDKVTGFA